MLPDLTHALHAFKSAFSRQRSWLLFCAIILSFLAATEMVGVTSMCRYWLSDEKGYHQLLHFFSCQVLSAGNVALNLASLGIGARSGSGGSRTASVAGRPYPCGERWRADA